MDDGASATDHEAMTTEPRDPTGPARMASQVVAARRRRAIGALLGVLAVVLVLYGLGVLLAPTEHADGACTGIGFGCTPSPRDGLILLGAIVGLPTLVAMLLLGGAAVAALLRRTRLPGIAAGICAGLAATLACGSVALLILLFL